MTTDQLALLEDKLSLWRKYSTEGAMDLRDYNRRCADALEALLRSAQHPAAGVAEALRRVLAQARSYSAGHSGLIDLGKTMNEADAALAKLERPS